MVNHDEILSLKGVDFSYSPRTSLLRNINFNISQGQNVGIVGESGSGKSTLLKILLGLNKPQSGAVQFRGKVLDLKNKAQVVNYRKSVQAVFQDPFSSLDPRQKVVSIISEPLISLKLLTSEGSDELTHRIDRNLEAVGLDESAKNRYPHEFSGGQRQRIAIARAIISEPALLLADEPVSSLDLKNREMILGVFEELKHRLKLTIAIVSHDLSVVAHLCEHVIVMEKGVIVEAGSTGQVLGQPSHTYTRKLLSAIPRLP